VGGQAVATSIMQIYGSYRGSLQGRSWIDGGGGGEWCGRPGAAESKAEKSEYFELKMRFSALKKFKLLR
jgi:hypothetical protein